MEEVAALMMLSGNNSNDISDNNNNNNNLNIPTKEYIYNSSNLRTIESHLDKKYEVIDPCNITALSFENNLNASYFRNNRSSGQKSLRCFPSCCERKGHENSGFCGRSIRVKATLERIVGKEQEEETNKLKMLVESLAKINKEENLNDYIAVETLALETIGQSWGQFIPLFILEIRPYKEARLSTQRNPIPESKIEQNLRDVNSRSGGGELVLGEATINANSYKKVAINEAGINTDTITINLVFNKLLHSWDYSWKSNRWSHDETHVVDIIAFQRLSDSMLQAKSNIVSNQFNIIGSKTSKIVSSKMSSFQTTDNDIQKDLVNNFYGVANTINIAVSNRVDSNLMNDYSNIPLTQANLISINGPHSSYRPVAEPKVLSKYKRKQQEEQMKKLGLLNVSNNLNSDIINNIGYDNNLYSNQSFNNISLNNPAKCRKILSKTVFSKLGSGGNKIIQLLKGIDVIRNQDEDPNLEEDVLSFLNSNYKKSYSNNNSADDVHELNNNFQQAPSPCIQSYAPPMNDNQESYISPRNQYNLGYNNNNFSNINSFTHAPPNHHSNIIPQMQQYIGIESSQYNFERERSAGKHQPSLNIDYDAPIVLPKKGSK